MIIKILKKKSKWYWRMESENRKVFCHSEQFHTKSNAMRSAKSAINNVFNRGIEIKVR